MKVKNRSVCNTCRVRKLGCDGKVPRCSQCVLTKRECSGYSQEWVFVQQDFPSAKIRDPERQGTRAKEHNRSGPKIAPQETCVPSSISIANGQDPFRSSIGRPLPHDLIDLVVRCYIPDDEVPFLSDNLAQSRSRICGAWVEVLPNLSAQQDHSLVLSSAVNALAISILHHKTGPQSREISCSEALYSAIRALRKGFATSDGSFHAEFAAASMCLALAELMIPSSAVGWIAHVRGVGEFIRAYGPELYRSGIPHKLFVGVRPLLLLEAFHSRRSSFLALERWKVEPFTLSGASPMQSLLSHAAIIPSILEKIDTLLEFPSAASASDIAETWSSLVDALVSLEQWQMSLANQTGELYRLIRAIDSGTKADARTSSRCNHSIWFPNVMMANAFTHLWAFQIVCLVEIQRLKTLYANLADDDQWLTSQFRCDRIQDDVLELSETICQSMEYLMQDEMNLFGPASTFYPLKTAYNTFLAAGSRWRGHVLWCQEIVSQLVSKGFSLVPLLILGN